MRTAAAALFVSALAFAQQDVAPATLPADWAQRDLEGKWAAYRAAIDGNPQQNDLLAAWARALGNTKEFELLEWIVVAEGWRVAGPELLRADAPQLLRAAAWNFANFDSHGKDAARKVLLDRANRVLGWLDANPASVQGPLAELRLQLVAAGARPDPDPDDLPPLDPMQMLVPWLDAPAQLADFGARTTAAPKVRYVHQVLRALDAVLAHGDAEDLVLTKVMALTKHPHAAVRLHAFTTLSKLPAGVVPFAPLARVVDDAATDGERRRLAVLSLSYSAHPAVGDVLLRVATDPAHPGHAAALLRLGERGDAITAATLTEAGNRAPELAAALAPALAHITRREREGALQQLGPVHAMLLRAAWLRTAGDARAAATWTATATWLRANVPTAHLDKLLRAAVTVQPPQGPFRGDEATRVEAQLQLLVGELLNGLGR